MIGLFAQAALAILVARTVSVAPLPAQTAQSAIALSATDAESILGDEPGAAPIQAVLLQSGSSSAGSASGSFELAADLHGGHARLTTASGGVVDGDGWDGGAWSAHDGAVTVVDLASAVADARAEAWLRTYAWRDAALRGPVRPIGRRTIAGRAQSGVEAQPPGSDRVSLWFDTVTHRLAEAVIDADMGPTTIAFSDWREVNGAAFAFRREHRDPTGQITKLSVERTALLPGKRVDRPKNVRRGEVTGRTIVPFAFDHGNRGHIVVGALINGMSAKLVFDTGAATYLTPAMAMRYGLQVGGGLNVGGVGETSFDGGFARIRKLQIGKAALYDTSSIAAPLPDAATHPRPGLELAGLTGFELLHAFRTTIDYGTRTIEFADPATPPAGGGFMAYASDGEALFVKAAVNGRKGWFRVDTGDAGTITVFGGFAANSGLRGGFSTRSSGEIGGGVATAEARFETVEIAGIRFAGVQGEISAQQAGAFHSRYIAGNLGVGALSCFRITIDPQLRQIDLAVLPSNRRPASCTLRRGMTDTP